MTRITTNKASSRHEDANDDCLHQTYKRQFANETESILANYGFGLLGPRHISILALCLGLGCFLEMYTKENEPRKDVIL